MGPYARCMKEICMKTTQLSDLLACLYRAPLESGGWQEFLDCLTELTGAGGGGFLHHDLDQQKFTLRAVGGAQSDSAVQHAYNSYYGRLDPWRNPYLALRPDAVVPGHALVPVQELRKTEIYNDLLRKNGIVHPVILPGIISPSVTENVTIWWSEESGPPGDDIVALMEMLRPHLKTSLQTLHAMEESGLRARSAQAVLDHMHQAVFLLDESLQVRHQNEAAEHLLRRNDGLQVAGGRLRVAPKMQQTLDLALGHALLHAQASLQIDGPGTETLALLRPSGKRALPTRILPLRVESLAPTAHVLVLVNDTTRAPAVSLQAMRALFAATPTEVAIANGLLAGHSVGEIARLRRISEDTTRSHLKTLFQRTGTCRQSDLVLLLLGLPRTWSDTAGSASGI